MKSSVVVIYGQYCCYDVCDIDMDNMIVIVLNPMIVINTGDEFDDGMGGDEL